MISSMHPGLLMIFAGLIAAAMPKNIRRILLVAAPLAAFGLVLQLSQGTAWCVPFINGLTLHIVKVDGMNWIFAFIFSLIATIGGLYALNNEKWLESSSALIYAGSSICAVLAGDWLSLLFFWELMAAASLFLLWSNNTPASRRAGYRYILVHMFGGNLLLAGILLKVFSGSLLIENISANMDLAGWLILSGICINCAVVPLHAWLVDAYPEASISGSLFLSCFTTKVAVYALVRLFAGTECLVWLGVIMTLYGACFAVIENNMRRLLSYHIISQVGFMVAVAGLGTQIGSDGAIAHAFTNITNKSLLFMCVGTIIYSTGVYQINRLGGMARKLPFTFGCFIIGAFAISGIPLFSGFTSKSLTILAATELDMPVLELLLQLAGIGTFLSISMKMLYFIFLAPDKGIAEVKRPVPLNMKAAMGLCAVLCTIYGLFPNMLYSMLPYQITYQPFTVDHVIQYVQLLGIAMVPFMMFLPNMEPHDALYLDTDWFYRRPFAAVISALSSLCCAVRLALSDILGIMIEGAIFFSKNPMVFLRQAPRRMADSNCVPEVFDPDAYRPMIGETMMTIMTVLLIIISYLALAK